MLDKDLFLNLLHKLSSYTDACVLDVILHNVDSDYSWLTSRTTIGEKLSGHISLSSTYNSLQRLSGVFGLIEIQQSKGSKTLIKVKHEDLLSFINDEPVSELLPGLRTREHPFLRFLNSSSDANKQNLASI